MGSRRPLRPRQVDVVVDVTVSKGTTPWMTIGDLTQRPGGGGVRTEEDIVSCLNYSVCAVCC